MKKLFLSIITFCVLQANAQSSCENAAPFCAGGTSGGVFPATTGTTSGQIGPNYNCNGLIASPISWYVPSPSWYYLQVGASGSLDILIQGQQGIPPNTSPGGDVDFVCWGPFNSLAGICNSLTANNNVDCSYSPSYTETLNIPNGISGQYYIIVITNFYNQPQNIVLTQIGGTGNTNCSVVNNSSICSGGSKTITIANSTTLTNISYSIQPGGLTNSTGSFVVTPSVTTSYTTYLTGQNGQNTSVTQISYANVTVNPQPFSTPTATQVTCTSTLNAFNLGLSFSPSSPIPSYTVNWAPTPNGISTPAQVTLTGGIVPGIYNYSITAAGGCSTTSQVTINSTPPSTFAITPAGPIYSVTCSQPIVALSVNEQTYNYTWANNIIAPLTGVTASFTSLSLGSWTVVATNPASGCSSIRIFTVALNTAVPVSSVNPINQTINCGPGVVATATGTAFSPTINVNQCWFAPGLPAPSCSGGVTSIYNPPVGTSTLVVTNLINGCSTTKTVQVVTNAANFPSFTAITSLMTANAFTLGCGTRSLITDITMVGGTTPFGTTISYTLLPSTFTGTNYTTGNAATYSVNTPGAYVFIIRENNSLCETRVPLSITQNTQAPDISAEASITRTLSCFVPSVSLIGSSESLYVSYVWKSQVTIPPTVQNSSITVKTTSAGASVNSATVIDTYTLTVTDNVNTCTSNTVVTIYQNTRPPKALISLSKPALTCAVYSVNLTNSSSTGVLPGSFFSPLGIGGKLWEGPPPQQDLVNSSSYLAYTPGAYTLTAIDLNNGCTSQTVATVGDSRVYPVITGSNLAVLDCGDDLTGTKLATSVSTNSIDISWTTPPFAKVGPLNTLTLTTNSIGFYRLTVTTKSNSCASYINIQVIDGKLNADFTSDQTFGYAPLTVNFTNNSASSSTTSATSSITSVWSFGNGTTRTTTSNIPTSAIYSQAGTYSVTLFTAKGSCSDTLVKIIKVDIPSKLEVPNVFTPNGDNSNDIFFVKTANLSEITALIYDRWGNKIYELTTDKGNIAWDGKTQTGKEAPDGTYFYIITAKGKDGQDYNKKGTVSLYR